jgi:hypothetical protein
MEEQEKVFTSSGKAIVSIKSGDENTIGRDSATRRPAFLLWLKLCKVLIWQKISRKIQQRPLLRRDDGWPPSCGISDNDNAKIQSSSLARDSSI